MGRGISLVTSEIQWSSSSFLSLPLRFTAGSGVHILQSSGKPGFLSSHVTRDIPQPDVQATQLFIGGGQWTCFHSVISQIRSTLLFKNGTLFKAIYFQTTLYMSWLNLPDYFEVWQGLITGHLEKWDQLTPFCTALIVLGNRQKESVRSSAPPGTWRTSKRNETFIQTTTAPKQYMKSTIQRTQTCGHSCRIWKRDLWLKSLRAFRKDGV